MVERIRTILQARQLTPTQFADAIGVARPIVSHVLSGRNKPSLEVVQKIIAAFPELSLLWLLSGTGPMLPAAAPGGTTVAVEAATQPLSAPAARPRPAPPKSVTGADKESTVASTLTATRPELPTAAVTATAALVEPEQPPVSTVSPATEKQLAVNAASPLPAQLAALSEPGKSIRRIVIFYHDGTFSDFQPE